MSLNVYSELARSNASSLAFTATSPLMTLTYRSRPTVPMSSDTLSELQRAASGRNHAEGVTGMVLYDEHRFFQWLEGPPASIARVWSSISRDPRHTDIEAISVHAAPARLFSQWDMRLFTNRQEMAASLPLPTSMVDPDAQRLATLAIGDNAEDARSLLLSAYTRVGSIALLTEQLIEPAARHLGDLWSDDDCGEYEVTLGLCRLQTFMRDISAGSVPDLAQDPLVVLVAPLPGEIHLLGATLGAEAVWKAGWETHVRFPSTEEALKKIVATNWFDAIDLSLSPSMQREHRLAGMEQMIASVRRASRNPALIVVAGGRAFYDRLASNADVGADAVHRSATELASAVAHAERDAGVDGARSGKGG